VFLFTKLRLFKRVSFKRSCFIRILKCKKVINKKGCQLPLSRAGEPERPEPHDLAGDGAGARAILFFLQESEREPEHFKKLEWSRSWSRSWHKLVQLQAPAVFENFLKSNGF